MYNYQKGALPRITWLLGGMLACIAFLVFLAWAITLVKDFNRNALSIDSAIAYTVVWLIPLFLGRFLMGLFPAIQLTDAGIRASSGARMITMVRWEEIEQIVGINPQLTALMIHRRGLPLLNGLYFNLMYGFLVRSEYPVILLSSSLERKNEILARINENSKRGPQTVPAARP